MVTLLDRIIAEVRPFVQTVNSDATDRSVELTRCDNDTNLPVASTLFEIGEDGLPVFGSPRCDVTPLFVEYCDAAVRCTFSQDDFRRELATSAMSATALQQLGTPDHHFQMNRFMQD